MKHGEPEQAWQDFVLALMSFNPKTISSNTTPPLLPLLLHLPILLLLLVLAKLILMRPGASAGRIKRRRKIKRWWQQLETTGLGPVTYLIGLGRSCCCRRCRGEERRGAISTPGHNFCLQSNNVKAEKMFSCSYTCSSTDINSFYCTQDL